MQDCSVQCIHGNLGLLLTGLSLTLSYNFTADPRAISIFTDHFLPQNPTVLFLLVRRENGWIWLSVLLAAREYLLRSHNHSLASESADVLCVTWRSIGGTLHSSLAH